jgi:hypothetical protein
MSSLREAEGGSVHFAPGRPDQGGERLTGQQLHARGPIGNRVDCGAVCEKSALIQASFERDGGGLRG